MELKFGADLNEIASSPENSTRVIKIANQYVR